MRVGLLIYGSLDTVSGGYLYDRKLVEYLRRQGDSVEIFSLPWRSYFRCLGDNFSASLLSRLAQARLDVLLQDELNHPSLFLLNRRLRRIVSYPLVSIVHHLRSSEQRPSWQNAFYGRIERLYLNSVQAFIYNSQTTRREVRRWLRNEVPSAVIYPGGDRLQPDLSSADIRQRALEPGPLRLLFLGNLIPRKGLHHLIQALSRLASLHPGVQWELKAAGSLSVDPAYTRLVLRQIRQAGLESCVHLLDTVPDADLRRLLENSHVLATPSSYEGFGIVYLEAMGYGLPVIAGAAGAAAEMVTHGVNGFLIPTGDVPLLAECLLALAGDRDRLARMSLAARERYAAFQGWEESMQNARQFLQELLEKGTMR